MACGRDNKKNEEANIPPNNCLEMGGYGCSWSNYPTGYQQYPTSNGYYMGYQQGYSAYSGYNLGGCPTGSYPIYDSYNGLACIPVQNPQNYYWSYPWGAGNSGYLVHCNPMNPRTCPSGICVPISQINNNYNNWNDPRYSNYGVCQ